MGLRPAGGAVLNAADRLGAREPGNTRPAPHPPGTRPAVTLTAGERRVVRLVLAGRTNREVAAELRLAVSTVEACLWRVYRKLGVRSRVELARLAGRRRPSGPQAG